MRSGRELSFERSTMLARFPPDDSANYKKPCQSGKVVRKAPRESFFRGLSPCAALLFWDFELCDAIHGQFKFDRSMRQGRFSTAAFSATAFISCPCFCVGQPDPHSYRQLQTEMALFCTNHAYCTATWCAEMRFVTSVILPSCG